MGRLLSAITAGALFFGSLVNGQSAEANNKQSNSVPHIEFSTFDRFYPESLDDIVIDDKRAKRFFDVGLDFMEDGTLIKDKVCFKEWVLDDFDGLGVSREMLQAFSIHDSVTLACSLPVHKFEYWKDPVQNTFSIYGYRPTLSLEVQKKAEERIETLRNYNKLLADEIYHRCPQVVCRHYARVASAIYDVLREINPRLKNSKLSCYFPSNGFPHIWNQITVVSRDADNLKLDVAFVDPTWFENNKIEGIDEDHMGKRLVSMRFDVARFYRGFGVDGSKKALEIYKEILNDGLSAHKRQYWYDSGLYGAEIAKDIGESSVPIYLQIGSKLSDKDARLFKVAREIRYEKPREAMLALNRLMGDKHLAKWARIEMVSLYLQTHHIDYALQTLKDVQDDPLTLQNDRVEALCRLREDFAAYGYGNKVAPIYSEVIDYMKKIRDDSRSGYADKARALRELDATYKMLGMTLEAQKYAVELLQIPENYR